MSNTEDIFYTLDTYDLSNVETNNANEKSGDNDERSTAQAIESGHRIDGIVDEGEDYADYYKISEEQGDIITAFLEKPKDSSSGSLTIETADGTVISTDIGYSNSLGGLSIVAESDTTYYLRVGLEYLSTKYNLTVFKGDISWYCLVEYLLGRSSSV